MSQPSKKMDENGRALDPSQWVSNKEARKILDVSPSTLRNYTLSNKIVTVKTNTGRNRYNRESLYAFMGIECNEVQKVEKSICYARVSSSKQKDDLERQIEFFRHKYPNHEVVFDIGSGINWKRKGLQTIWNNQCREMSKKLWLPIETDSVDLDSNLSNLSLTNQVSNSWFTITKMINPNQRNLQMTSCQSSTCTHVDKWENEDTSKKISGTKKIKLNLTSRQKSILNEWFGTSRYVYNKTLDFIQNKKPSDFVVTKINLRDEFVTNKTRKRDPLYTEYQKRFLLIKDLQEKLKHATEAQKEEINTQIQRFKQEKLEINSQIKVSDNPSISAWELNTPKEVRAYMIDDLLVARKAAFSNLRNGNINRFKMSFRTRKSISQTISVPKSAVNFRVTKRKKTKKTKNRISIYVKKLGYIKTKGRFPKTCEYDLKINRYNNTYFLCLPYAKPIDRSIPPYKSCALDPGARTMHVLYSEHEVLKLQQSTELMKNMNAKVDLMSSLKKKAQNAKHKFHSYQKRLKTLRAKIRNRIDDMHYKFINYLTSTYQKVYLPSFESQDMMSNNTVLRSTTKRTLNQLRHYKFKQRLQSKAKTKSHCEVFIVSEDYTTKTCTNCGAINDVQGKKKIRCNQCNLLIDRDINGSRNIFIKIEHKQLK